MEAIGQRSFPSLMTVNSVMVNILHVHSTPVGGYLCNGPTEFVAVAQIIFASSYAVWHMAHRNSKDT